MEYRVLLLNNLTICRSIMKKNKLLLLCLVLSICFSLPESLFAQVSCSGGSVVCANGMTPVCPSADYGLSCYCGLPQCVNRAAFNNAISSGFESSSYICNIPGTTTPSCPVPLPVSTPTLIPVTQPTTPTCSPLIATICASQGTSPNYSTCTCNPITPTAPTQPTIPTVMCATGLTACPNATASNFQCCRNGCSPSNPFECKSDTPASTTPELVLTGPESINLSAASKMYSIDLMITGLNFASTSNCSVSTSNTNLRMKFNPTGFSLEAGKSSEAINVLIRKSRALTKTNQITIQATCSNGTKDEININVLQ